MIIVSDTTPLRYLGALGELELLPRLFGQIVVPSIVISECLHHSAPENLRIWAAAPPDWLVLIEIVEFHARVNDLDPGEAAAITAALSMKADLLLIDERKGRARAASLGLKRIGTLAILAQAGRRGWLDYHQSVDRLVSGTNFRVSAEVVDVTWQQTVIG